MKSTILGCSGGRGSSSQEGEGGVAIEPRQREGMCGHQTYQNCLVWPLRIPPKSNMRGAIQVSSLPNANVFNRLSLPDTGLVP